MKKTLFLLSFLLYNSFLASGTQQPNPVIDFEGKNLLVGVHYYILPVIRGRGGGLTLGNSDNETCPLDVVQEKFEVKSGLPLTFTPVNTTKGVVPLSTDLNIKFFAATICVQSTVWKLDYDAAIGQYVIVSGGVEGNPGRETTSNWFKIEKYDRAYKLVFCPTVCKFCKVICKDVGIFIQNGRRRLALSDAPFRVMFKRA
ncbi:hypothetical protein ACH5RR_033990 [Cinchona calisaya]|uniref:Uncharacterized protein n=1 Tax=Cinchona calisaya TaxID=153742 RepID=A0ABD2Y9K2_9GENT